MPNNCTITDCRLLHKGGYCFHKYLINSNANNCTITACQSCSSLINGDAINSKITDCLVIWLSWDSSFGRDNYGGIANTLKNSTVERCLVMGGEIKSYSRYYFSGITDSCDASTIHQCAIGKLGLYKKASWGGRIAREIKNNSTLENNISIDSNGQYDDLQNGKSISAGLFNQYQFERTLGWDFNTVWQWDTQQNHPVLRAVGVNAATASPAPPATAPAAMVDLLSQQIQANIWL